MFFFACGYFTSLQHTNVFQIQMLWVVTLPETTIAMENPLCWWYIPGKIGIFTGKQLVSGRVHPRKWNKYSKPAPYPQTVDWISPTANLWSLGCTEGDLSIPKTVTSCVSPSRKLTWQAGTIKSMDLWKNVFPISKNPAIVMFAERIV